MKTCFSQVETLVHSRSAPQLVGFSVSETEWQSSKMSHADEQNLDEVQTRRILKACH